MGKQIIKFAKYTIKIELVPQSGTSGWGGEGGVTYKNKRTK